LLGEKIVACSEPKGPETILDLDNYHRISLSSGKERQLNRPVSGDRVGAIIERSAVQGVSNGIEMR
jgi:hypothetical protein